MCDADLQGSELQCHYGLRTRHPTSSPHSCEPKTRHSHHTSPCRVSQFSPRSDAPRMPHQTPQCRKQRTPPRRAPSPPSPTRSAPTHPAHHNPRLTTPDPLHNPRVPPDDAPPPPPRGERALSRHRQRASSPAPPRGPLASVRGPDTRVLRRPRPPFRAVAFVPVHRDDGVGAVSDSHARASVPGG